MLNALFTFVLVVAIVYLIWEKLKRRNADENGEGNLIQDITDWLKEGGMELVHPVFYAIVGRNPADVRKELEILHTKLADPDIRATKMRSMQRTQALKLLEDPESRQWIYDRVEASQAQDKVADAKTVDAAAQRLPV